MQGHRWGITLWIFSLAAMSGIVHAQPISGMVTDLSGNGLNGACITLTTSDSVTSSDPTGEWFFLSNRASGISFRSQRQPNKLTEHLVFDAGRIRLRYGAFDGSGRRQESLFQGSTKFHSDANMVFRSAAISDSLEFSWRGKVRARVPLTSWVPGAIERIDTSSTGGFLPCKSAGCMACSDSAKVPRILVSSSFEKDTLPWYGVQEWIGVKKLSVVNGELKMAIAKGSDQPWHIMLQRSGMPIDTGKIYIAKLQARASKLPFKLVLNIQASVGHGVVLTSKVFVLSTTMRSFYWDFAVDTPDPAAMIQFNMGGQGDDIDVTLDNFQIFEAPQ